MQVDLLVFDAAPEPFSEDVVHHAAAAIHADLGSGHQKPFGKTRAEEFEREIATPDEARKMLGLKGIEAVNF